MSLIWTPDRPLERLVSEPLDLDYEAWRASRFRFASRRGEVARVRSVGGASFLTGTQTELIYANTASGTAKNTFTTEAQINDTAGMGPQPVLPPYFFLPSGSLSKSLRMVLRGQIITTTTGPTWTFFVRFVSTAGPLVAQAGASTGSTASLVGSSINSLWEVEFDTIFRVLGAAGGNNSTARSMGLTSGPGLTPTVMATWGNNVPPGDFTFDIAATNTIFVDAACGTSNAANGVQLFQLLVMGLN